MLAPLAFTFSGQGSQYGGMARAFYEGVPAFRDRVDRLDWIVAQTTGRSPVRELILKPRVSDQVLVDIEITHPTLFVVQLALAELLIELGLRPRYLMGASLGELIAAAVSGVVTTEVALAIVTKQARVLARTSARGGMMALLGNSGLFQNAPIDARRAELAASYGSSHFVVAGDSAAMDAVKDWAATAGIPSQKLNVDYGFHSAAIDNAESTFYAEISDVLCLPPRIPLVSCAFVGVRNEFSPTDFWTVVRKPVRFREALAHLEQLEPTCEYVDVSPGGGMATLLRHQLGRRGERVHSLLSQFSEDVSALPELVARLGGEQQRNGLVERSGHNMQKRRVVLFPGQGSQRLGMGEGLFERYPEVTATASNLLGYSVSELCSKNPEGRLTNTAYTQPALFVVNALHFMRWCDEGGRPDFVAGHSLGEYNALHAAGAFSFEDGLRLVQTRGALMGRIQGGAMAAVVGLPGEKVREVAATNEGLEIDIANLNAPDQVVIAGTAAAIARANDVFIGLGARAYIPLQVSGAFHSRHMRAVAQEFEAFLSQFRFGEPQMPVIANAHARPYDGGRVAAYLAEQLVSPVKWTETIEYLLRQGDVEFIECGPGNVLTKLVDKIRRTSLPESTPKNVDGEGVSISREGTSRVATASTLLRNEAMPSAAIAVGAGKGTKLGSISFRTDHGVRYSYAATGTWLGINGPELVFALARAGFLAYLGVGGLNVNEVEQSLAKLRADAEGLPFGLGLTWDPRGHELEDDLVALALRSEVRRLSVAGYVHVTPALVRFRVKGLRRASDGAIVCDNHVLAKISRTDVAETFMEPPPAKVVAALVEAGLLTVREAELAQHVPMADDVCIDGNSGGSGDIGTDGALLSVLLGLRAKADKRYAPHSAVRIGSGEVGDPIAIAAAFFAGVDFVHADSVNSCTVEAAISPQAKELLQQMSVHDTDVVPAAETFELGGRVRVLRRGVLFAARATRLHELQRLHRTFDSVPAELRTQLQDRVLNRVASIAPSSNELRAERDPGSGTSLTGICHQYLEQSARLAVTGDAGEKLDYQLRVGPSLGAFNQFVRSRGLQHWRTREVALVARLLMDEGAAAFQERLAAFLGGDVRLKSEHMTTRQEKLRAEGGS